MMIENERKGIEKRFYELTLEIVSSLNLSLYDLEYVKTSSTLKVFIVNEETNTAVIEECVAVDRAFTPYVEDLDWIPESLVLEVSSPGLYRKLKTIKHFERSVGSDVELVLKKDIRDLIEEKMDGLKGKKIKVSLKNVKENGIDLIFGEYDFFLDFENVKKANLSPEINF